MSPTNQFRVRLANALQASTYQISPTDDRLSPLVEKLELLQTTGRYTRLLTDLFTANDHANLRSLILEATFAFQFEKAAMPLHYEVKSRQADGTSVDFLHRTDWGKKLCIEMRLVQQRQKLTTLFEEQLQESEFYGTSLDGDDDREDTLRLQRLIFEKAINHKGELIKFTSGDSNSYNIVAIEVSQLHLGMIDDLDCMLVAYEDPSVPEYARRGLFGLFQETQPSYADYVQKVAIEYAPFRAAVHALLFLRQVPDTHPITYELEYLLIGNKALVTSEELEKIGGDFNRAMKVWKSVRERNQSAH